MSGTGAQHPGRRDRLIASVTALAQRCADLRAAYVVGSVARTSPPADEWSDIDLILVSTASDRYLGQEAWLRELGNPALTFIEPTGIGTGWERRVLFDDGLDVDIVVFDPGQIEAISRSLEAQSALRRGVRVLCDKDGLLARMTSGSMRPEPRSLPTQAWCLQHINDYWYHAVWTAKKLRRGELWVALDCLDGYMQHALLAMVECHARCLHGPDFDTWHKGRFIERWAEPWIVEGLRLTYARYDAADAWNALAASMTLYRRIAQDAASRLGLRYPEDGDRCAMRIVETLAQGA